MVARAASLSLPTVAQRRQGGCGAPRASRAGRWRALVLIGVYGFFVGHFIHWQLAGKTLSPFEPSEAMQTLEQGLLNCGFVVLLVGVGSTLLLGRWFCGWGCHIIALQDLCTWACRKLRFRPKPFRSRLLVFVPLAAGLYMFVWPSLTRWLDGRPAPAIVQHFLTHDYWATFPGPIMSAVTALVCGLLIVLLLGNKGYCTYACPYGGLFGVADKLAVGRIRVTEACAQCGHCTATCTSNVRVHEEVKLYGMVVDPGCMKCTDCISVCPKDALYFGFGRPSAARGAARAPRAKRDYDYTWPEEFALAAIFLVSLYAFRGLYDAVPFLLALGLAAITAYLLVQAGRLCYAPSVRVHAAQLKLRGRWTGAGVGFAGLAVLVAAFVAHSTMLQYHVREGERMLDEVAALQASAGPEAPAVVAASRTALAHFGWIRTFGWLPHASTETRLGALHLFLNELDDAEQRLEAALRIDPGFGAARYKRAELRARRGELERGLTELRAAVEADPSLADARRTLTEALVHRGELAEAVEISRRVVERRPVDVAARLELAGLLAESGARDEALEQLREAVRQQPALGAARLQLGLVLADLGRAAEGLAEVRRAAELSAGNPRLWLVAGTLAVHAGDAAVAADAFEQARSAAPLDAEVLRAWAAQAVQSGRAAALRTRLEARAEAELAAQYALAFLHIAAGEPAAGAAAWERARARDPSLALP